MDQPEPTRKRIMRRTEELLLDHPLADLTVGHIANASGISRQAFYKHFGNIDDLVMSMVDDLLHQGYSMQRSFTWSELVEHWLGALVEHRTFFCRIAKPERGMAMHRNFCRITLEMYRSLWQSSQGGGPSPTDDALLCIYVYGGIAYLVQWIQRGMDDPTSELLVLFEESMPPVVHDALTGHTFGV